MLYLIGGFLFLTLSSDSSVWKFYLHVIFYSFVFVVASPLFIYLTMILLFRSTR